MTEATGEHRERGTNLNARRGNRSNATQQNNSIPVGPGAQPSPQKEVKEETRDWNAMLDEASGTNQEPLVGLWCAAEAATPAVAPFISERSSFFGRYLSA